MIEEEIIEIQLQDDITVAVNHFFTFEFPVKMRRTLYGFLTTNNLRVVDVSGVVGLKVAYEFGSEFTFVNEPTVQVRADQLYTGTYWHGAMPFTRRVKIELRNCEIGDHVTCKIIYGESGE